MGTAMDDLQQRGLVRNGYVWGAYLSPSGELTRIEFDGGWCGVADWGNAMPDDRLVILNRNGRRLPVRLIRMHTGAEKVCREDLPAVMEAVRRCGNSITEGVETD